MSGRLIIMTGLPRSGKSTWSEKYIDRKPDTVLISNDWIRENIFNHKYASSINPALWMISDACIRIILSQGKTVILDGINHTRFVRGEFIKTAKEMEAEIESVHIATSLEICLERNDKLPDDKLKSMAKEFEKPSKDEGFDQLRYIK